MQISSRAQYIEQMRARTAYPTFRGLMNAFLIINYILAGFMFLSYTLLGVGLAFKEGFGGFFVLLPSVIFGAFIAAIIVILAKVFYEASIMLADIADSLIDQGETR